MRTFLIMAMAATVGFASGEEERRVDAIFAGYAKPGSPGCAVGVRQHGSVVLRKGYGYGDLEHSVALSAKSRFYMASVSKQFTAMSLLLAEQEGKLRLDDSIRKYAPELPAYADGITIRRMLDHTAGLRDYLALWSLRGFTSESVLRESPTVALIARQKVLNFAPGTEHNYSNSGYLLAALALRRATGKSLAAYAQEKIFQPLEMRSTRFQDDHGDPLPDRAHGYHRRDGGWKTIDVGFDIVGSGGLYSTIDDMLRWARNFESPTVGSDLLPTLQTPGTLTDGRPTPGGYALGLIAHDGTIFHSGSSSGYVTFFLRVPKSELTVICLCNDGTANSKRLASQVAAVYTGIPVSKPAPPVSAANPPVEWKPGEMERLSGSYWSEELFSVWELAAGGGKFWLKSDGPDAVLAPTGDGSYKAGGFELSPKLGPNGEVTGFEVSVGRARGIRFMRR